MPETRQSALAKVKRAVARRRQALKDRNWVKARRARRVANKYRKIAQRLRARGRKPPIKRTFRSVKNFFSRPLITPRLIVLHSTESSPGSGFNVSAYLSHGNTQADCHIVVDTDGTTYRLVPDNRKAWHVGVSNGFTIGIEQVGRASQAAWPDAQLDVVARWLAFYSHRFGIPLVDARKNQGGRGIVTHASLPGDHTDPGVPSEHRGGHYPFDDVIRRARQYAV